MTPQNPRPALRSLLRSSTGAAAPSAIHRELPPPPPRPAAPEPRPRGEDARGWHRHRGSVSAARHTHPTAPARSSSCRSSAPATDHQEPRGISQLLAVLLNQAPGSVPVWFISAMDTSLSLPHCHGHVLLVLGAGCQGPPKQLYLELNCQWHQLELLALLHFSGVLFFSFFCGKKYICHCLERVNHPKSSSVQGCQH